MFQRLILNITEPPGKVRDHLEAIILRGMAAYSDKDKQEFRRDVLDNDVVPNLEELIGKFLSYPKSNKTSVLYDSDPIALLEVCCSKAVSRCNEVLADYLIQYAKHLFEDRITKIDPLKSIGIKSGF